MRIAVSLLRIATVARGDDVVDMIGPALGYGFPMVLSRIGFRQFALAIEALALLPLHDRSELVSGVLAFRATPTSALVLVMSG